MTKKQQALVVHLAWCPPLIRIFTNEGRLPLGLTEDDPDYAPAKAKGVKVAPGGGVDVKDFKHCRLGGSVHR